MPDLKFSCPKCGQHISCGEAWRGQTVQCPSCQTGIKVPEPEAVSSASGSAGGGVRLAAGVTQVARASSNAPATQKRIQPRGPKSTNPAVRLAGIALVIIVLAGLGLKFIPALVNQAKDLGTSKSSSAGSGNAAPGSAGGGPLGEVNGAMDVSDALDGNSTRARPASGRQPANAQLGRAAVTNNLPKRAP
ncbi:MAG TPA: hypothetical protein VKY92_11845 [Verrucomicrobiae bacterium]|nr:hypothetical protein [Verrucomicrobiae bacterium]